MAHNDLPLAVVGILWPGDPLMATFEGNTCWMHLVTPITAKSTFLV
jgi:hypothetical protein